MALRKKQDLEKVRAAKKWKPAVAHYLASVTYADARVGQLLKGLDQSDYAKEIKKRNKEILSIEKEIKKIKSKDLFNKK